MCVLQTHPCIIISYIAESCSSLASWCAVCGWLDTCRRRQKALTTLSLASSSRCEDPGTASSSPAAARSACTAIRTFRALNELTPPLSCKLASSKRFNRCSICGAAIEEGDRIAVTCKFLISYSLFYIIYIKSLDRSWKFYMSHCIDSEYKRRL